MKYSAVIFDLFGTLVKSLSRSAFERMLSDMAKVLAAPDRDFVMQWENTWEKRRIGVFPTLEADIKYICQLLDTRPAEEQVSKAAQIRIDFARTLLKEPREGAMEILTLLKDSGYKTGLISNCAGDIPRAWSETPLAGLVDIPTFSCSVGLKKPDPQVYLLTSKLLALAPKKCVYIADGSERELTGASGVGMQAVLFRGPDEDPYDEGQDRREWRGSAISSFGQIRGLLDIK